MRAVFFVGEISAVIIVVANSTLANAVKTLTAFKFVSPTFCTTQNMSV